jgi:hypothetical protein
MPYAPATDGSYNGFAWSTVGGNAYLHTQTGVEDLPGFRRTEAPRAHDVGWFSGPAYLDAKTITMQYVLRGIRDGTLQTNIDTFLAATAPQDPDVELPLYLLGSTRLINAKVSRRTNPYDRERYGGAPRPTVEFLACDPRMYDANLSTVTIPLAVASGGASWPWAWPVSWGSAGTSGAVTVTNAGNFPTKPVAVFTGPVDNPQLQNATAGLYVQFAITLGVSDTLTVDFDARSVLLNNTAPRRNTMLAGSTWWGLGKGTSQILYSANTVQVGSTCILTWRSAWV